MKKIKLFLLLLFLNCSLFADIDVDAKDRIDALLNKTNSIAKAHIALIEDRGLISTSLATLISNGYIDPNITATNLYSSDIGYETINVTNTILDLDTNIATSQLTVDERSYLLNNSKDSIYGRVIYEKSGEFWVKYFYSGKAVNVILNNNIQNTYIGEAEPTSYATVSSTQTWWDSNDVSFNVKKYVSSFWVNEDYSNQNLNFDGTFSNLNTLPLSKTNWKFSMVNSVEQTTPIICDSGANYNQVLQRCEAYTSNACDENSFDSPTGLCYKRPINYCSGIGFNTYDEASNNCSRQVVVYTNKVTVSSTIYSNSAIILQGRNTTSYEDGVWDSGWIDAGLNGFELRQYGYSSNKDYIRLYNGVLQGRNTTSYEDGVWDSGWIDVGLNGFKLRQAGYSSNKDYIRLYNGVLQGRNTTSYEDGVWDSGWIDAGLNGFKLRQYAYSSNKDYIRSINICSNGATPINGQCATTTTTLQCPSGYTETTGTETAKGQCKKPSVEYANIPNPFGSGYGFSNNSIGGKDAYIKSPSCSGRAMSASPYSPTLYYGNNGLCYSDAGLYCKNTGGISYDGFSTCWKYNQSCNSGYNLVYNFSSTNDKCSKFNYSCPAGNLYGLLTHPTNNNTLDLFNRVSDKDTKATTNITTLLIGNRIVNDNNGAMCVQLGNSTLSQPTVSPSYNINSIQKSGF